MCCYRALGRCGGRVRQPSSPSSRRKHTTAFPVSILPASRAVNSGDCSLETTVSAYELRHWLEMAPGQNLPIFMWLIIVSWFLFGFFAAFNSW